MQSALEGSLLMPFNRLKSLQFFSKPCSNSLPCGEGLGVGVVVSGRISRNTTTPLPTALPQRKSGLPDLRKISRDPGKPGARWGGSRPPVPQVSIPTHYSFPHAPDRARSNADVSVTMKRSLQTKAKRTRAKTASPYPDQPSTPSGPKFGGGMRRLEAAS